MAALHSLAMHSLAIGALRLTGYDNVAAGLGGHSRGWRSPAEPDSLMPGRTVPEEAVRGEWQEQHEQAVHGRVHTGRGRARPVLTASERHRDRPGPGGGT